MMEVLKRKIWVTRNGVNVYDDVEINAKDKNQFVFNAAVSKGMETLLEDVWPRVKERIPQARLVVIGGAYPLKNEDIQHDKLKQLTSKHFGKNGVTFTGIIDQERVSHFLRDSSFMIYPQSFPETFGISTVESLAYGTPVISGRFGAMEETAIEQACYLMDYPVDSNVLYTFNRDVHISHFVDMVVDAYNNEYLWQQKANSALRVREVCGWDKVALQWRQHLFQKTGRYLPVKDYHEVQRINHRTHEIFNKRWSNPEEWAYYPEKEKMLEIVVPFYNASQYLRKCIESIAAQNYENFRLHLIDDKSEDDSHAICEIATRDFNLSHLTCQYKTNDERVGALANQVRAIKYFSKDSIVVLIDGDDALINDPNVFKKINAEYHRGAEMTYGSMWSLADNIPLIAQEYPREVYEKKSFRSCRFPWKIPYTHLRTFTVEAFDRINDSDLRDSDGNYYKAAGDSALFYSLLDVCKDGSVRAIRDVLYLYNDLNPINDYKVNSPEQIMNSERIAPESKFVSKSFQGVTIKRGEGNGPPLLAGRTMKRILIAIPTALNIHPETFKAIYDLETPENCEVDFQFFYGYCIDQIRNLIASYAINNGYDYLFAVDYDMEFPPDTLVRLFDNNVDIVSGLYIQRKPGQHILEIYRNYEPNGAELGQYNIPHSELNNILEEVDGCGFGCVLIKTEVLKEVGYPQFTYHHAIRIEDTISEDVDFCRKAKAKGFGIYANTLVKCRHHGKTAFEV
jgi:GT2 family glycosyltransferase